MLLGLWNIRSISTKVDIVYEILGEGLDILVLTETWHRSSSDISVKLTLPPGYNFVDKVRFSDPSHSGLIVYFRSIFKFKIIQLPLFKTFEALALKLNVNKQFFIVLAVYRPGSAQISSMFFVELRSVLDHITLLGTQIIVVGDLNVHIERVDDHHTISFIEIFDQFKLNNRINEPTHIMSGILDLVFSSYNLPVIKCKVFPSSTFSDHSLIYAVMGTN